LPDHSTKRHSAIHVDAKYKRHWEEIGESGWRGAGDELRDLLSTNPCK